MTSRIPHGVHEIPDETPPATPVLILPIVIQEGKMTESSYDSSESRPRHSNHDTAKRDLDFGWRCWKAVPIWAKLVLEFQKGSVLDVGCGTCQLLKYLRSKGWSAEYVGVDLVKYPDSEYPKDASLVIGDALRVPFPKADTVVLANVLEHVDDAAGLLRKALAASSHNVIINVPKRNERMWESGVVEFHQLDKSHRHCGYTTEEIVDLVRACGGSISEFRDVSPTPSPLVLRQWRGIAARSVMNLVERVVRYLPDIVFESESYFQEIWCEVVKRS